MSAMPLVALLAALAIQPHVPDPLPDPQSPRDREIEKPQADLRWARLAPGLEHATLVRTEPVLQTVQVLRIDLSTPGLSLILTPGNGEADLETNGQTASAFVSEHGLAAAVNAHFFSPCCAPIDGQPKDLTGLAIADGELVSPHEPQGPASDLFVVRQRRGLEGRIIDATDARVSLAGERLTVSAPPARQGIDAPRLETIDGVVLAAAGTRFLAGGAKADGAALEAANAVRQPRTAIGVRDDGRTLYLVAVDGRQPGHSLGATLGELADIMIELGCEAAMNVDGGGSTAMVIASPDGGEAIVVNQPSAGRERVNGSHLGVRVAKD